MRMERTDPPRLVNLWGLARRRPSSPRHGSCAAEHAHRRSLNGGGSHLRIRGGPGIGRSLTRAGMGNEVLDQSEEPRARMLPSESLNQEVFSPSGECRVPSTVRKSSPRS